MMMRWVLAVGLVLGASSAVHAQEALWEIYNDAGSRALNQGFPADAEKLWKSALEVAERSKLKDAPQVQTLDSLFGLYREQGKRAEAAAALLKALALTEECFAAAPRPAGGPETTVTPGDFAIAGRCQKLGEFYMEEAGGDAKAEPYFSRALKLWMPAADLQTVAGPAIALYTCYLQQNKLTEAEQVIRWCIGIAEKNAAPSLELPVVPCLLGLAMIQIKRKLDSDAIATFREALIRQERVCGSESPALLWTLFRTGDFYHKVLGRPEEAEPYYRRALALAVQQGPRQIPKQAECTLMLAEICQATHRDAEARRLQESGLAMFDKSPVFITEGDKRNFALVLLNAARVSIFEGRYAEAEGLCTRSMTLLEALPSGRAFFGIAYRVRADCCLGQNRLPEAEAFAKKALEADQARWGKANGEVALDLSRLARVNRMLNREGESERFSKEAVQMGETELDNRRPYLREVFDEYRALLQKQGKTDAVNQLEAKAKELHLPPSRGAVR